MYIETFELERNQSLYENTVQYNLTESGLHPFTLEELLSSEQLEELLKLRLGYGQTNGDPDLRALLASYYSGYDADNIIVTNGSAEANYVGFKSLLEPGDEVVLMQPNYQLLYGLTKSLGCEVKPIHLKRNLGWELDLEELRSKLSDKTKVIAICNPNNPTGAVLSPSQMKVIVNLAREFDCYLFSDEIYIGSELSGELTPSFHGSYEKTVIASGLAKSMALPGLRIGWLAGPREVIDTAWHHHDYTSISTGMLSQYVARIALAPNKRNEIFERGRQHLRKNLPIIEEWVEKHSDALNFIPPQAGGMAFVGYNFDKTSDELVTELRESKSVFVVAGSWFGMENYLRIGIGVETKTLKAGLALIDEYLSENQIS